MQPFLRRLLDRAARKADRSAAGTLVPAGMDPAERSGPTAHERTLMRRRLRALRKRRESSNGHAPELAEMETEEHALETALNEKQTLEELIASGASARCPACGELVAPRERQCWACGAQLGPAHPPEPAHHSARQTISRTPVTGASSGRSSTPPAR